MHFGMDDVRPCEQDWELRIKADVSFSRGPRNTGHVRAQSRTRVLLISKVVYLLLGCCLIFSVEIALNHNDIFNDLEYSFVL